MNVMCKRSARPNNQLDGNGCHAHVACACVLACGKCIDELMRACMQYAGHHHSTATEQKAIYGRVAGVAERL